MRIPLRFPLAVIGFAAGLYLERQQAEAERPALEQTARNLWRRGDRLEALVLLIAVLLSHLPALRPMVARLLVIPAGLLDVSGIQSRATFNEWLTQVRAWLGITPPPIVVGVGQGVGPCGCHEARPSPDGAAGGARPGSSIADPDEALAPVQRRATARPKAARLLEQMTAEVQRLGDKAQRITAAGDRAGAVTLLQQLGPLAALLGATLSPAAPESPVAPEPPTEHGPEAEPLVKGSPTSPDDVPAQTPAV